MWPRGAPAQPLSAGRTSETPAAARVLPAELAAWQRPRRRLGLFGSGRVARRVKAGGRCRSRLAAVRIPIYVLHR